MSSRTETSQEIAVILVLICPWSKTRRSACYAFFALPPLIKLRKTPHPTPTRLPTRVLCSTGTSVKFSRLTAGHSFCPADMSGQKPTFVSCQPYCQLCPRNIAIPMMKSTVFTPAPTVWSSKNFTAVFLMLSCFFTFCGFGAESFVAAAGFSLRARRPAFSVPVDSPVTASSTRRSFSFGDSDSVYAGKVASSQVCQMKFGGQERSEKAANVASSLKLTEYGPYGLLVSHSVGCYCKV